ncbi:MAG: DUF4149 domain-containing protein [Gammaproteobacteria bacterium]|nr:DUF4149 domain-containing protein [Gammaproteobacteria bacterium]
MLSIVALSSSILLGSMLFFATIVTPSVFQCLDTDESRGFLRHLFPRFYLWGIALSGSSALLALFAGSATTIMLVIVLLGFIYSRQILTPKINAAKDAWLASDTAELKSRFRQLHKRSVIINVTQMVLLLIVSTSIIWALY